jgi:asparagine synthase (glutamine-hydrolysing)
MCGFSCEIVYNGSVEGICPGTLNHRGPDNFGTIKINNAYFRHWRLSIKDVSDSSNQPFVYKSLVVVFNGEVYNFKLLRRLLLLEGYIFETTGDTEVFVKGFYHYKSNFFGMIDGMYSCAIYNSETKSVIIARDKFGQKPLFYSVNNKRLIIGSELKVFSLDFGFKSVGKKYLKEYMSFGYNLAPNTLLNDVKALLPGEILTFDIAGQIIDRANVNRGLFGKDTRQNEVSLYSLKDVLIESVNSALDTDVKTGIFLSGGVDSSILAIIAKKYLKRDVSSLTYCSDKVSDIDNSGSIQMAKHLGLDHIIIKDSQNELKDKFYRFLKSVDQPSNDGFNTFLVSEAARESGFKVMLSGVGADELFGGYPFFYSEELYDQFGLNLPLISRFLMRNRKMRYFFEGNLFRRYALARFGNLNGIDEDEYIKYYKNLGISLTGNSFLKSLTLETYCYMSQVLLRDMDQYSMANSIELRAPFLGNEIVNLFNYFDFSKAYRIFGSKGVLKHLFKDDSPENFFDVKKQGFEIDVSFLNNDTDFDLKCFSNNLYDLGAGDLFGVGKMDLGKNFIRRNSELTKLFQLQAFFVNHGIDEITD